MRYVIVTCRSLAWTLLSLVAFMAVLSAVITPRWLVGPPTTRDNETESYRPSVGIFNRCTRLFGRSHCGNFNLDGLITNSTVFPDCWKASLFFLSLGLAIMALTIFAAVLGCCVQAVGRKSIFSLTGLVQAIAGVVYLIGITLYPFGWGAKRVQRICGSDADVFYYGDCSLGWAFYSAAFGIFLTFVCAGLSSEVEKSTASDKVQDKLNEGTTLICLV